MTKPVQLPIIFFRGRQWYVDVRLRELRLVEMPGLTPLRFEEFDAVASDAEWVSLAEAMMTYYQIRSKVSI